MSKRGSKSDEWKPRLSVNLTEEQHNKLQKLMPWGTMGRVYSVITDDLIKALERHGEFVIAAITSRRISILDIIDKMDDGK